MKLNPGITRTNFIAYAVLQFVTFVCLQFIISFVIFILKDKNYYDVNKDELGSDLGKIGMWAEVVTLVFYFFLGPIFDTFGRKVPIVLGFLLVALSIALIPMCRSLFPAFLILRTCISLGTVIGMNVPLLPDYVQKESMGLANGYIEVVICSAFIFASTGLY